MEENVNKLLEAEKNSNKIIEAALLAKTAKIREAAFFAKGDIEKYRQAQEEKYISISNTHEQEKLINTSQQADSDFSESMKAF